ncbi:MAG: hypothetical protein COV57_01225 [Candidatus Liptonbacteria bacterium CG11_big_fil_rev_8_21_14_0_20_35_14]|uniref:2'-deoxynucleoside 5'-phosphate N-hydrolase 1 n=1 Tax=Candidatus Liptonbacteria bacterium CG11_big_fil_rev_8_21_14_0_20_35_14 TaxID=1974634 RepID=A0A2H0N823_9BACT|nr:MAG: hypothetical protein COV57_01225 [Candidatus Liptonbacteria bacterium CG11_big_fil_rev_8_21_14_0_20_35_14]
MQNSKVVYFAGAIRGDRSLAYVMRKIVEFVQGLGLTVLTEHVIADDPIATFAGKVGKEKADLLAEDVEQQDIAWLDQATHVIAEISGASTGTGREIEYARTKGSFGKVGAKVLCLYHTERELFASPMVRGMTPDRYPNVVIRSYTDVEEAKSLIKDFLEV